MLHTFEKIKEELAESLKLQDIRETAIRTASLLIDKIQQNYPRYMIEEGIQSEIPDTNLTLYLNESGLHIDDGSVRIFADVVNSATLSEVTAITIYINRLIDLL